MFLAFLIDSFFGISPYGWPIKRFPRGLGLFPGKRIMFRVRTLTNGMALTNIYYEESPSRANPAKAGDAKLWGLRRNAMAVRLLGMENSRLAVCLEGGTASREFVL